MNQKKPVRTDSNTCCVRWTPKMQIITLQTGLSFVRMLPTVCLQLQNAPFKSRPVPTNILTILWHENFSFLYKLAAILENSQEYYSTIVHANYKVIIRVHENKNKMKPYDRKIQYGLIWWVCNIQQITQYCVICCMWYAVCDMLICF